MSRLTVSSWKVAAAALALVFTLPLSASADAPSAAGKYIDKLGNQALDIIVSEDLSRDQKQAKLEKLFAANVDIPWVGRFVLGRYWKQATDEQKKRYLKAYESFLVRHYTSRFADYTGGTFRLTGTKENDEGEQVVSMELVSGKGNEPPVLVDYRVRPDGGGFRIIDVVVEGVSLITTQRSEFGSVLTNHDIDYLITQLENRSLPAPE